MKFRMKVGTKVFAIVALMAVALAAVAGTGLYNLRQLNERVSHIVDVSAQKMQLAARAREGIVEASLAEKQMILAHSSDDIARYAQVFDTSAAAVETALAAMVPLADEAGLEALGEFREYWDAYLGHNARVRELAAQRSDAQAREQLAGPAATAIADGTAALEDIISRAGATDASAGALAAREVISVMQRLRGSAADIIFADSDAGYDAALRAYRAAAASLEEALASLRLQTGAADAAEVRATESAATVLLAAGERITELGAVGSDRQAYELATGAGRQAAEAAQATMTGIVTRNDAEMAAAAEESRTAFRSALVLMLSVLVASAVAASVVAWVIARSLSRGVRTLQAASRSIAEGDTSIDSVVVNTGDELAELAADFNHMRETLQDKIVRLRQIADGDLTVHITRASERDLLAEGLIGMKDSLNDVLGQVVDAVEQVSAGADQISQASQNLSQGATEQASSVEEISSSLNQVSGQARQNADNSTEASALARQAFENARKGDAEMKELSGSIEQVNEAADQIRSIVKVIDDIAFQINLLALNANVEAARAGEYGKGFAVVADEVRNLAARSAESVKETTTMVDAVLATISSGSEAARRTASQLAEIVTGAGKISEFLEEIALASNEQAQAVNQVNEGLEQIDQVTQSNTASAEETASASEELAGQSQQLKAMVGRFRLERRSLAGGQHDSEIQRMVQHELRRIHEQAPAPAGVPAGAGQNGHAGRNGSAGYNGHNGSAGNGHAALDPRQVIALDDDDFGTF